VEFGRRSSVRPDSRMDQMRAATGFHINSDLSIPAELPIIVIIRSSVKRSSLPDTGEPLRAGLQAHRIRASRGR
jgi:hypothetical protein